MFQSTMSEFTILIILAGILIIFDVSATIILLSRWWKDVQHWRKEIWQWPGKNTKGLFHNFSKFLLLSLLYILQMGVILLASLYTYFILSDMHSPSIGYTFNRFLTDTQEAEIKLTLDPTRKESPTVSSGRESTAEVTCQPSAIPSLDANTKEFFNNGQRTVHYRYDQAKQGNLVPLSNVDLAENEPPDCLHRDAEKALSKMVDTAKQQGVNLVPFSGFRTYTRQAELFDRAIQRHGSEAAAAFLSAPPGYSEHHTGFAVDIGDGKAPKYNLKYDFEYTEAYVWLQSNARKFKFELSFPRDNQQGISFEPWHWRFVGTTEAKNTFKQ